MAIETQGEQSSEQYGTEGRKVGKKGGRGGNKRKIITYFKCAGASAGTLSTSCWTRSTEFMMASVSAKHRTAQLRSPVTPRAFVRARPARPAPEERGESRKKRGGDKMW